MGGVLRKAGVSRGGETRQLGQLLLEALPADPVLDGSLALEVLCGAIHILSAPRSEVHLRDDSRHAVVFGVQDYERVSEIKFLHGVKEARLDGFVLRV